MKVAVIALIAAFGAGCGTSCPVGSSLRGATPPAGQAQWCQRQGAAEPTKPPAAKNEVLGSYRPHTQGKLLVGPYTDWHANGLLRAAGAFELRAGISAATGVWTFFDETGRRAVEGRYVAGYPVGCFAVWTDRRERLTFAARAGRLRKVPCTPPRSPVASRLAEKYRRAKLGQIVPELFSIAVGFMVSPNSVPVDSDQLMQPDAAAQHSVRMGLRRKLDWAKLGVVAGVISTDEARSWIASAAALGSVSLLPNNRRFDVELSSELGVRMFSVWPHINATLTANTSERFVTPYIGAQVAGGYHLTETLSIYAAVLAQQDLPRTVTRLSRVCTASCVSMEYEWDVGGGFVGALLQLRVVVR